MALKSEKHPKRRPVTLVTVRKEETYFIFIEQVWRIHGRHESDPAASIK